MRDSFDYGLWTSVVRSYTRSFVETHMGLIELTCRLACPDDRFSGWAEDVGVACGPLPPGDKEDRIHELDAVVAYQCGLSEKHLVHIFETFHEGWDYDVPLRATLKHFREWRRRRS